MLQIVKRPQKERFGFDGGILMGGRLRTASGFQSTRGIRQTLLLDEELASYINLVGPERRGLSISRGPVFGNVTREVVAALGVAALSEPRREVVRSTDPPVEYRRVDVEATDNAGVLRSRGPHAFHAQDREAGLIC